MNERDALMHAICTNPDDDTPRLVFADWLQENGEQEYAEFVRLQVRHAELLRYAAPDTDAFARRARKLWLKHQNVWRAALPRVSGLTWHDAFFRGFVERATVASDAELVRHADAVFGQPIRQLVIVNFSGATGFAALPGLARLRTLTVVNSRATPKAVDELLECGLSESALVFTHFTFVRDGAAEVSRLQAKFGARLSTMSHPPTTQ